MSEIIDSAMSLHYTRKNRKEWGQAGFRAFTAKVHDDDRDLLLAYIEVLRTQRMVTVAQTGSLDDAEFVATRNIQKSPTLGEFEELKATASKLTEKQGGVLDGLLGQVSASLEKSRVANKEAQAAPSNVRLDAQYVAYQNLAGAHMRYARAWAVQQIAEGIQYNAQ